MKSYQEFFAELKRRKVFKVAAVYGVAAFILLQVADLLGQGLRLGDTFLPFVTAIVLLGFPFALVMAWVFEMTEKGVQRTTAPAAGEIEGIVSAPLSQRWPAGLMALVGVAALVGGAWWVGRQSTALTDADAPVAAEARLAFADPADDARPSIAVLPFVDMSPEQDQEYFGDGMTEEILSTLIKIRDLRVSGRTSTFAYKDQDKDLRQIGTELGVRYIVEGSVRKQGNQLRITAQLIDAADGSHLWGDQYDRPLDDVFAIQTEIAKAIAAELRVPLGLGPDETLVMPTADLDAYDLYLAGRSKMRERGSSLLEAIDLFEAAIARDSVWAPAWAGLAETSEIRLWYPSAMPTDIPRSKFNPIGLAEAERAARRALELDPRNASALVALGSVQRNRAEWDQSEATYLRALATDPDNAKAHLQYGDLLLNMGRIAEGVRAVDRAAALDRAAIRIEVLGWALEMDDRREESMEAYELALTRNDSEGRRRMLSTMGHVYTKSGRWDDAAEAFKEANRQGVEDRPVLGSDAQIDSFVNGLRQGNLSLIPVEVRDRIRSYQWLMLGERDSAVIARLESLQDRVFGRLIELRMPADEPLLSDPRIQAHLGERGMGDVEVHRTPEAERTRPLVLREADD